MVLIILIIMDHFKNFLFLSTRKYKIYDLLKALPRLYFSLQYFYV
jgi:hypothetical protein